MSEEKLVSRSAVAFSAGTFLSRISGLLREQATAYFFGTSSLIASFFIAYRLALALRRLLGEGALLVGFVPYYESARKISEAEAIRFFRDTYVGLSLLLAAVLVIFEMIIWSVWKWAPVASETQDVLYLVLFLTPGLFFICLAALSGAHLQCEKQFFLPAIAPAFFNLGWVVAIIALDFFDHLESLKYLALCTVVSFALQWCLLFPQTLSYLKQRVSVVQMWSPEIKEMLHKISITVIGVGAIQINGVLDLLFIRGASLEGPAYLNYAARLHQFPIALIGVALSSALLPSLSRALLGNDWEQGKELLQYSLKRAFYFLFPGTLAIFVLGFGSVELLYGRGRFTFDSACGTTACLWALGIGLIPAVFSLLIAQAFYAQRDYKTPVRASLQAVGLNVVLNALFVFGFQWGPSMVPLATSIASFLSFLYLKQQLTLQIGPLFSSELKKEFLQVILFSSIAALVALGCGWFLFHDPTISLMLGSAPQSPERNILNQLTLFIVEAGVFAGVFFGLMASKKIRV